MLKRRLFIYFNTFLILSVIPIFLRYIFQKYDENIPSIVFLTLFLIINLFLSNYLLKQNIWIKLIIGICISLFSVVGVYQLGKINFFSFILDGSNYVIIFLIFSFTSIILQELSFKYLNKKVIS
jgi:hypothetical protein